MKNQILFATLISLTACTKQPAADSRGPASVSSPRFERSLAEEAAHVKTIEQGILYLQAKQATESGKQLRGTHAKGVCAQGDLEISDLSALPREVASRLRVGVFASPDRYPTKVRFANAEGKVLADQAPDVRAVSLSVQLPQALSTAQGLMDFAMNNAPTFPINDAKVFADLMVVAQHGLIKGGYQIGLSALMAVKNAMSIGGAQKKPAELAYQSMRYWSDVPFALGDNEAVKYSLKPCANNSAKPLTADADTLSKELVRHLREDATPACFEFQVQLLEAAKMKGPKGEARSEQDWVEDAAVEWPENEAPFYTVGRLSLQKASDYPAAECEAWKVNVIANTHPAHRGLGSINRARALAEASSAEKRGAQR